MCELTYDSSYMLKPFCYSRDVAFTSSSRSMDPLRSIVRFRWKPTGTNARCTVLWLASTNRNEYCELLRIFENRNHPATQNSTHSIGQSSKKQNSKNNASLLSIVHHADRTPFAWCALSWSQRSKISSTRAVANFGEPMRAWRYKSGSVRRVCSS